MKLWHKIFIGTLLLVMLAVDLIYALIDPRIKAQYSGVKKRKAVKA